MSIFESPEATHQALRDVGYLTGENISTLVYMAGRLNRPLLLEGPAGAGKTEMALRVARAANMKFVRLQCYTGISDKQAIGDYNRALQDLYVLMQSKKDSGGSWDEIRRHILGRDFFAAGPLLEALESRDRVVLLIDELDKVDYAFEALLLEILSVWEMSIPGMGTIRASHPPFTVITSNAERALGMALRRRSFYLEIGPPTAVLEAEIVARKTPDLPAELHIFIAGLAKALRAYSLEKPPSISEMTDLAMALNLLGKTSIDAQDTELLLPLFGKTKTDTLRLRMKDNLRSIVGLAHREAKKIREDIGRGGELQQVALESIMKEDAA